MLNEGHGPAIDKEEGLEVGLDNQALDNRARDVEAVVEYRGVILDEFQEEAIRSLMEGQSVLVSAPTGAGKTLIADYLIEQVISRQDRAIYTAPIKALSNQKYKDFKALHGADKIGIVTGDVVINDSAPILVMTTEILRNILHTDVYRLEGVSHVIFDEIHYIGNEERGSVWEEAIIFLPKQIRILGLSATIPNATDLARWMSEVRGEKVRVVRHQERPVPLDHYVFEKSMGPTTINKLVKHYDRLRFRRALLPTTTHLDLIKYLSPDLLPCLYFLFSRRQCEIKARELAQSYSFLKGDERRRVRQFFDSKIEGLGIEGMASCKALRQVLSRGIGFHHAGLLPVLKEIVEELFAQHKISVLYCTETFALGVNLPVKTVCFDSPEKFDGIGFRPMTHQEYFQMAGRAGRRGIDSRGYVFTLADLSCFRREQFPTYDERKIEDLESQFKLSYNTVLNLVSNYDRDEIQTLLDKSFAAYQRRRRVEELEEQLESAEAKREKLVADEDAPGKVGFTGEAVREDKAYSKQLRRLERKISQLRNELSMLTPSGHLMVEFDAKVRLLSRLGYIEGQPADSAWAMLTEKGRIASRINVQELLVTELIADGMFHQLDEDQINALAVAIDYESRREVTPVRRAPFDLDRVLAIARFIQKAEVQELGASTVIFDPSLSALAYMWSRGAEFADIMAVAAVTPWSIGSLRHYEELVGIPAKALRGMLSFEPLDEGDIVMAFRRAIDLIRQVKLAMSDDHELVRKLNRCMDKMDRDVVRVDL